MVDWQDLVRQRLSGLALDAADQEEVHAELAAHLEESYEHFRKQGLPEQEAARRALAEVSNWRDLQRAVWMAKRGAVLMQNRVQQLWIPGFITLVLSMVFLAVLQKEGFHPRVMGSGPGTVLLYLPWLVSLPFFGALGAYVSSRAGGSWRTMLLASVFPVVALASAFLLMLPMGLTIELVTGSHVDFSIVATALLRDGIGWLLIPGVALLAGGLPIQFFLSRRLDPRRTAGS